MPRDCPLSSASCVTPRFGHDVAGHGGASPEQEILSGSAGSGATRQIEIGSGRGVAERTRPRTRVPMSLSLNIVGATGVTVYGRVSRADIERTYGFRPVGVVTQPTPGTAPRGEAAAAIGGT